MIKCSTGNKKWAVSRAPAQFPFPKAASLAVYNLSIIASLSCGFNFLALQRTACLFL